MLNWIDQGSCSVSARGPGAQVPGSSLYACVLFILFLCNLSVWWLSAMQPCAINPGPCLGGGVEPDWQMRVQSHSCLFRNS